MELGEHGQSENYGWSTYEVRWNVSCMLQGKYEKGCMERCCDEQCYNSVLPSCVRKSWMEAETGEDSSEEYFS